MKTLITMKLHIDSQITATTARLTAARKDEDRYAKRIERVTSEIYKIGSNGDPDTFAKCSARYKELKGDLADFASRSTAITNEANELEDLDHTTAKNDVFDICTF
jgi:hypothetical protein